MPQRPFKTLFIACSLLLSACQGTGPKVGVYVSDPASNGLQGVTARGDAVFLPYDKTENFVCFEPNEARTLLEYCKKR